MTRFTSSGIRRSKLLMPASTWATGMPCLTAAERPRKRRIRVTEHDYRIGSRTLEYRLECHEHSPGLLRVAAASNPQRVVRLRQAQLGEEDCGHPVIPVLAGVDEDVFMVCP